MKELINDYRHEDPTDNVCKRYKYFSRKVLRDSNRLLSRRRLSLKRIDWIREVVN